MNHDCGTLTWSSSTTTLHHANANLWQYSCKNPKFSVLNRAFSLPQVLWPKLAKVSRFSGEWDWASFLEGCYLATELF